MKKYPECIPALRRAGISETDAFALRRIAMQLHRWHELECGIESGGVERDETTGKTFWYNSYSQTRTPCADRETPALKRLEKIMTKYDGKTIRDGSDEYCPRIWPRLGYYVQGDPRGASLYIIRPDDVPEGESVDAYYSRGLAVYK